ncbi:MAG TPA: hypothetical protein VLX09_02270 [Stellaceae bacterium]|nr:hypothetical protein [Stellaceae bacterium]
MGQGPTGDARRDWRGSRTARFALLATCSALGLMAAAGPAHAQATPQVLQYLSGLRQSGNPFLIGFAAGVTPGFTLNVFQAFDSETLSGIAVQATQDPGNPGAAVQFLAIERMTVTGNVLVPQGVFLANEGALAPPAIVPQLVAFNLTHALPATFLGLTGSAVGYPGLYLVQSSISGVVSNAGTIAGYPNIAGTGKTLPGADGIFLTNASAGGITNSGLIASTSGSPGIGTP